MLKSIRDILICICLVGVSFAETQYADILVEGDVKSFKSYWTINPVTFRPLKILSKVGLVVNNVQSLKRVPVDNDDYVDGNVTYVGNGYRLEPVDLKDSNLATKILIRDISSKKGTQLFDWGAAPDADKYIYKAGKLFTGSKHPAKFRGVLRVETYVVDNQTKIYSKLDVVEIEQDNEHYRNIFLRELFTDKAEKRTKFDELYAEPETNETK